MISEATSVFFVVYDTQDEADDSSRAHHPEIFGVSRVVANHNSMGDSFVASDRSDAVIVQPRQMFTTRHDPYKIPVGHYVERPYIHAIAVLSTEEAAMSWSIRNCKKHPTRPRYY
jgi:hypothetical protein